MKHSLMSCDGPLVPLLPLSTAEPSTWLVDKLAANRPVNYVIDCIDHFERAVVAQGRLCDLHIRINLQTKRRRARSRWGFRDWHTAKLIIPEPGDDWRIEVQIAEFRIDVLEVDIMFLL